MERIAAPRYNTARYKPMAASPIKFGTSGWRGIIAEDFTFGNVRIAVAAIAEHVLSRNARPTLLVAHDTRFFSEEFARAAAAELTVRGVKPLLCKGATPTPSEIGRASCRERV